MPIDLAAGYPLFIIVAISTIVETLELNEIKCIFHFILTFQRLLN